MSDEQNPKCPWVCMQTRHAHFAAMARKAKAEQLGIPESEVVLEEGKYFEGVTWPGQDE